MRRKVPIEVILTIMFWLAMIFVLYLIIRMVTGYSPLETEIILALAGLWFSNSIQWGHIYYRLGRIEGRLGLRSGGRSTEESFR